MSRWQSTARASSEAPLDRPKGILELSDLSSNRMSKGAFTIELFLKLDDHLSLILKFALILSKSVPKGVERIYI